MLQVEPQTRAPSAFTSNDIWDEMMLGSFKGETTQKQTPSYALRPGAAPLALALQPLKFLPLPISRRLFLPLSSLFILLLLMAPTISGSPHAVLFSATPDLELLSLWAEMRQDSQSLAPRLLGATVTAVSTITQEEIAQVVTRVSLSRPKIALPELRLPPPPDFRELSRASQRAIVFQLEALVLAGTGWEIVDRVVAGSLPLTLAQFDLGEVLVFDDLLSTWPALATEKLATIVAVPSAWQNINSQFDRLATWGAAEREMLSAHVTLVGGGVVSATEEEVDLRIGIVRYKLDLTLAAVSVWSAGAQTVLESITNWGLSTYHALLNVWANLLATLRDGYRSMLRSWSGFLGSDGELSPAPAILDPAARAALKEELILEIEQDLIKKGLFARPQGGGTLAEPAAGLIVFPATSDPAGLEAQKAMIADSFSDEVVVTPDQTGRAGILQPIFRSVLGDKYLFVITPVNTSP